MDNTICYLNTDLDLVSSEDLTALAKVFEIHGGYPLHVTQSEDGLWYTTIEMQDQHTEPESNIAAMVAIAESLEEPHLATWQNCTLREFNIGYDCGDEPWAFNQGLSTGLLGRLAGIGASLRWTIYPDRDDTICRENQDMTDSMASPLFAHYPIHYFFHWVLPNSTDLTRWSYYTH